MARDNDIFKFKRSVKKDETVPAQAQVILGLIHDAGSISRADLLSKLTKALDTKQPVERVLSFYRSPLVNGGFITIEPGAQPEKPAKAPKVKAAKAKAAPKKAQAKKPAAKKASKKKAPVAVPQTDETEPAQEAAE